MAFGIFMHRTDTKYDDSPAERYQFPRQYLSRAREFIGDWIVYLEPKRVQGTRGYFAVAMVQQIIPDPSASDMHLALIEPTTYLDFPNPVQFGGSTGYAETGVLNAAGAISGRAQSAVRPLSNADFNRIIGLGLGSDELLLPRVGRFPAPSGFHEQQAPLEVEQIVDRRRLLVSRTMRDRAFRQAILTAYNSQCAVTGLRLINGGGRAEVEAAHIKPVEAKGPDEIRNGLALSGTAHWMFDRGLIGIDDNYRILVSRQVNDADGVAAMINETGHLLHTSRPSDRPSPKYLSWHRDHCFKG